MNVYFILYYHLFFHNGIYFFEYLYFSECDIRMFLCVFGWERGHHLSTTQLVWNDRRVIQNSYTCVQGEERSCLVCAHVYVHTGNVHRGSVSRGTVLLGNCPHTIFLFLPAFLSCNVLVHLYKLSLPLFKKRCWWWSIRFSHARLFWALNWDKYYGNLLFSVKGLGSKLLFFGSFSAEMYLVQRYPHMPDVPLPLEMAYFCGFYL